MVESLDLSAVIGFSGNVGSSLHVVPHQSSPTLVYPMGATVVVRSPQQGGSGNQVAFLQGHSGPISCLAVSPSGRMLASGQSTHMGFKADIMVWDLAQRKLHRTLRLHKVKVQALSWSHDERYLASVGGQDDNSLCVWDVTAGKPVCGSTPPPHTQSLAFLHHDAGTLVSGGRFSVRVWSIDYQQRKMESVACRLGNLQRVVSQVRVAEDDSEVYAATSSGDVLGIRLTRPYHLRLGGPRQPLGSGVLSLDLHPSGHLVAGSGEGRVVLMDPESMQRVREVKVMGGVTSITATEQVMYVGTKQSVLYSVGMPSLEAAILTTCHTDRVNDIAFPSGTAEIFVTCSLHDIRVWNARRGTEVLRIEVPNLECNCVCLSRDGKTIFSGWDDGRIRAFGPETGKLMFSINDAHGNSSIKRTSGVLSGVTALKQTHEGRHLVSGGSDGLVRVWRLGRGQRTMEASMKQHKATVNCLCISADDTECISASDDGSCIMWSLERFVRTNIMYAQTYFKQAVYLTDESQVLTCGSNKKITYWDAVEGTVIREVEASTEYELNTVDIHPDGQRFVCCGEEKQVHVYDYDAGEIVATGEGHSGSITRAKFGPDGKTLVTAGEEGSVLVWRV